MGTKLYIIDGNRINDLDGFYDEVSRVLIPEVEWGHNLDAFYDILRGGFGTPLEGYTLVWKNSDRSRQVLGYELTAWFFEMRWERLLGAMSIQEMRQEDYRILKFDNPEADELLLQAQLETYEHGNLGIFRAAQQARRHQGTTVFDWLVSYVHDFPEIELRLE